MPKSDKNETQVLTPEQSAQLRKDTTIVIAYDRKPLVDLQTEWRAALEEWESFECQTLEDEDAWSEALGTVQTKIKEIEALRKPQTGPLDKELKALNKEFREYAAPLEEFKALASRVLSAARARRDAAEKAAKLLVEQAAETGDEDATYEALAAVPEKAKVGGTRTIYKWEFEVTDESKVEKRFMVFDDDLAKAFVAKAYGTASSMEITMPGFIARCVPSVSTNGRKA